MPMSVSTLFRCAFAVLSLSAALSAGAYENTSTEIFNPRFQTLKVYKDNAFLDPPVVRLGSGEYVTISFDEIGEDYSELQWRLIHCNADWQPSRLMESEYLDGFNLADIEDYGFSTGTFIHYVNYRFTVPSENMNPLRSGNYLVQVFNRYEPDETILQARLQIADMKAFIDGDASGRTDMGINTEFQQAAFTIALDPSLNINPYQDLIVTIEQNGRPETLRKLMRPLRVNGSKLTYESMPELIYPASNEYRRFETVRVGYPGMGVDSTLYVGPNYHAWLQTALPRAGRSYEYDVTQRGRFKIDEYNATDPDLGADYITVHFSLDAPDITNADIYVDGEFTHNLFSDRNRMKFNPASNLYELEMPLKQGSYNYQYVVKPYNGTADPAPIEGNYADTCNEYTVCVYLHTPVSRGDELIGTATFLSRP